MQYDTPVTPDQVNESLAADPNISTETRTQIEQILGTTPGGGATQVTVGTFDGTTVQAPAGDPVELLIIAPPPPPTPGTPVPIQIPVNIMQTAIAYVFQTPYDIRAAFNTVERVIASGSGNDDITVNGDKNTTLDGAQGNDTLKTSGGHDSVTGGGGNDSISTGSGHDTIVSGQAVDTVDASYGIDVVQMKGGGGIYDYNYRIENGQFIVVKNGDPNTAVVAKNVEVISFSEYENVVVGGSEEVATALRMYEGLVDRSGDLTSIKTWIQLVQDGMSAQEVARSMINSGEFYDKFQAYKAANAFSNDTEAFVNMVYQNTLDRDAGAGNVNFWMDAIANKGADWTNIAVGIVGSQEAVEQADFTYLIQGQV